MFNFIALDFRKLSISLQTLHLKYFIQQIISILVELYVYSSLFNFLLLLTMSLEIKIVKPIKFYFHIAFVL